MRTFLIWTAAVVATWGTSTIVRAQEEQAQATHTVAKKVKVNPRKAFREIDKRIDALLPKCSVCKGRGKEKVERVTYPDGETGFGRIRRGVKRKVRITWQDCSRCQGNGWVSVADTATFRGQFPRATQEIKDEQIKHQQLLDAFLDYFDLADRHVEALYKKLAERVRENRSRFLNEIIAGIGTTTMTIMTAPGSAQPLPGGGWRTVPGRYEERPVCRVYTGLSLNLILGKTSPIGHGIAFSGQIVRVGEEGKKKIAEVEVKGIGRAPIACFVIVPDGVRWVAGASVRVIGKVIDPSAFVELKKRLPDAVVVQPSFGTE